MHVAIAGGGLGGLACAKQLVAAGHSVTVLEGHPYLGGRASTFVDEDGDWVEQGLHLFLGVYSELKQLLRDVGSRPERVLRFTSELRLAEPDGPSAILSVNPLRAPLRTWTSLLLENRYLGWREKAWLGVLASPGVLPFELLRRLDDQSVTEWWRAISGSPAVLERFLRPFCRGIQFTDAEDFSTFAFFGLVHHVLRDPAHALLGAYLGPRDRTMFAPIAAWLLDRGATIRTGARVRALRYQRGAVRALVLEDGGAVEADVHVVALPPWQLVPLLPGALRRTPFFEGIARLPIAPAISVQAWFDGAVVDDDRFALVGRSSACVYQDLSRTHFPDPRGTRLSVIVSPADELLRVPDERIAALALDQLARADPRLRGRRPRKVKVLKHRRHLVRPLPGALTRRPSQATPVPNLFLAGDWTDQPFFGSQEGAVRGGNACARAILASVAPRRPSTRPWRR